MDSQYVKIAPLNSYQGIQTSIICNHLYNEDECTLIDCSINMQFLPFLFQDIEEKLFVERKLLSIPTHFLSSPMEQGGLNTINNNLIMYRIIVFCRLSKFLKLTYKTYIQLTYNI